MITHTNISKFISWMLRVIWLTLLVVLISACSLISSASADNWVSLGAPPSGAASVIAANGSEIWVSSNEGGMYSASVTFNCESGETCWEWQTVDTLPDYAMSISDLSTGPQSSAQCDTLNPNRPVANPNGNMVQCIYSPALAGETIAEFYFALMSDGTIMFMDNSAGFNPFALNSLRNAGDLHNQRANTACTRPPAKCAGTIVVGLPLRGVRVFKQFAWLEAGSVKVALSHPRHQRVTQVVDCNNMCYRFKPPKIAKFSRIFDDSSLKRV